MSSLGEIQQIYSLLQQIEELLNNIQVHNTEIKRNLPQTRESLRVFNQLEEVALRYLTLSNKIAGSDDATQLINTLSRVLVTLRQIQMAYNLVIGGLAMGGIGGVFGVAGGIAAIAITSLTMMEGY